MIKSQCTTQMHKLYQLVITINNKARSNTDTHNPILRFINAIKQMYTNDTDQRSIGSHQSMKHRS